MNEWCLCPQTKKTQTEEEGIEERKKERIFNPSAKSLFQKNRISSTQILTFQCDFWQLAEPKHKV